MLQNTVGSGFGPRFCDTDLSEFRRRNGLTTEAVNEALGELKSYRLHGGLLQRNVCAQSLGAFQRLTVIPDGEWRTVESDGARRRLSLGEFVILVFFAFPWVRIRVGIELCRPSLTVECGEPSSKVTPSQWCEGVAPVVVSMQALSLQDIKGVGTTTDLSGTCLLTPLAL